VVTGAKCWLPIKFSKFFWFSCLKGGITVKTVNRLLMWYLLTICPSIRADKDGTVISYAVPSIRYTTNHTGWLWSVGYLTQVTSLRPHSPTLNQSHLYPLLVAPSLLKNQQRFAISCFRSVYPHARFSSWIACIKKHYVILVKDHVTCCNELTNCMVHLPISYTRISLPVSEAKGSLQWGSCLEGYCFLSTGKHSPTFRSVVRVKQSKKPWTGWPWRLQSITSVNNCYRSIGVTS